MSQPRVMSTSSDMLLTTPADALLVSFLLPGAGQFAAGHRLRGLAWFGGFGAITMGILWLALTPLFPSMIPCYAAMVAMLAAWLCMLVDAWTCVPPAAAPGDNRPGLAGLLSSLMLGLGQCANRQWLSAVAYWSLAALLLMAGWAAVRTPWPWLHALALVTPLAVRLLVVHSTVTAYAGACRKYGAVGAVRRGVAWVAMAGLLLGLARTALQREALDIVPVTHRTMMPLLQPAARQASGRGIPADYVVVDKLRYRLQAPQRGEIVVFRWNPTGQEGGRLSLLRVAGLPWERARICPPYLYINGRRLTEPVIFHLIGSRAAGYAGFQLSPVKQTPLNRPEDKLDLAKDQYLLLGDQPEVSLDGRYLGPVSRASLVGRVVKVAWPLRRPGREHLPSLVP